MASGGVKDAAHARPVTVQRLNPFGVLPLLLPHLHLHVCANGNTQIMQVL
ncbi:hypothetical protein STIAU_5371 [Stigmatella aurantiaca DW4/3-1]|uniref:Uncharacterized protein n=1 Tax=Stigmatella aurantiaca (strain DW4/3-1) TaxID=378806 RepID=Q08PE1_STIAD|nr:hypothetical protein STIAU_5371 [Stigmatella aurantiaca DW4/3-1]